LSPQLILSILTGYFGLLLFISWWVSRKSDAQSFYNGNKSAPWYLVSFGMIGATLSGVTFISIPGTIGNVDHINGQLSYIQVIIGYILGYFVIAYVLLPLYYRLNLTSIYGYLEARFGFFSRKTGASFFLISRVIGASFRLYLVALVLDAFIFSAWGIPFWATVALSIVLIWIYTAKSGIKTIIYTDTIQTLFMLLAMIFTVIFIIKDTGIESIGGLQTAFGEVGIKKLFFWEWSSERNFFKQFLSGFFLALVMTGLDQDMMQKNLSCKNIKDAQKNMLSLSASMTIVNVLFVIFGGLLYVYAHQNGITIPEKRDLLYPTLALNHFHIGIGILFILGLTAAAYSSADSALTALTTSFVVDFLEFDKKGTNVRVRRMVHVAFSVLIFLVILYFRQTNDDSVITKLFKISGLTYGPLLGLFAFGILSKLKVNDLVIPVVCIVSAVISYFLMFNAETWFGQKIGFEILIYNGGITFILLLLFSKRQKHNQTDSIDA
jgi:Na+/proline symporter